MLLLHCRSRLKEQLKQNIARYPVFQPFSTGNSDSISDMSIRPRLNKGLESVKEQGMHILEATVSDIQTKTKRRLLLEDEDTGPAVHQLKEALKLKRLVEDAVHTYTSKSDNLFCIMNAPISIIDVEVTEGKDGVF